MLRLLLTLAILLSFAAPAAAAPATVHDRLTSLAQDVVYRWAMRHPLDATALGIPGYDDKLDRLDRQAIAQDRALVAAWQARLDAIPVRHASLVDRDDATLLRARLTSLDRELRIYRTFERDPAGAANSVVDALFTQFERLPSDPAERTRAWDAIVSRMTLAPAYIAAGIRLATRPERLHAQIGSEQLAGAPDFLRGALTAGATAQLDAPRLRRFVAARDRFVVALQDAKTTIDAHTASWSEAFAMGRAQYDAMLRDEQLLPFNGTAIALMGQEEIAHGWSAQTWVTALAHQRDTPLGPQSGGGIAPAGEALIPYYRDRLDELTSFVRDHNVVTIPSWLGTARVIETPSFLQPVQPGAAMLEPRTFGKETDGVYFITPPKSFEAAAKRLDLYVDFDRDRVLQTAGHEVMPGHFLQGSIARRHPDFIRRTESSTSFIEGWAYYGEELLWRLGLYGDDLDPQVQLAQWERIRGVRAYLDPKLASGEWTYAQAVAFFAHETGATIAQARGGVADIALNPGRVIAYTVGRQQIEALLGEFRLKRGANADLHEFHDRLLCYGSTPLSILGPELLADLRIPVEQLRASVHY